MNQYPEIEKVLTENPLIDIIVYECRQILKGIIIKDEDRADKAETVRSLREADLYHDILMGTDRYTSYEYTYDLFMKIPSMTPSRAMSYVSGALAVPEDLKPRIQALAREEWLAKFQDTNEYYRLLWGKPPIGEEYIYLDEDEYNMIPVESYDISKPVHMCTNSEASLLYSSGVIDHMKSRFPNAKYLDHLGDRSIDPYVARRTPKFGLLYIPATDSPEVYNKWKERYEVNRVYVLKTIYSEAYKFKSDYYDRFMMMLIVIMTMDDMITYSPEYIISRDLFDLRTIQYLFEACGVEFYPEIPLKYQKRLIKNLNRLIKYKSSAKCMVDIVSLFGYENMELFKYYLMKTPVVNEDGSYRKDTYTDPKTGKEVLDLENNYHLRFLRVPLLGIADDYIMNPFNWVDYDETAAQDIYWNGVYDHDYVKHEILKHEFDLQISKYISVETTYSLAEMQFQMVYFINMLLYSKVNTDNLLVTVSEISTNSQFKLVDLIIMLYALSYMYQGVYDDIMYDPIQSLAILGFNFNTDLDELKQYVLDQGFTLEEIGLDKFINPNPIGIRDWEELDKVYTNNKEVYDRLVYLMNHANDKDEYDVYRKVYQSLYVTRLNFQMFRDFSVNGQAPKTYTEYLQNSNVGLYNALNDIEAIPKEEDRRIEITRLLNVIVDNIYLYIDQDTFKFAFNGIPTVGLDYIRKYIMLIINFFKSYKVDVIHTNIIYKFDSRLDNKVEVIDKILFHYLFYKRDRITKADCFRLLNTLNWREDIPLLEKMYMDITYWKERHFRDDIFVTDRDHWRSIIVHFHWHTHIPTWDKIGHYNHVYEWSEYMSPKDTNYSTITTTKRDEIGISESIYFNRVYDPDPIT